MPIHLPIQVLLCADGHKPWAMGIYVYAMCIKMALANTNATRWPPPRHYAQNTLGFGHGGRGGHGCGRVSKIGTGMLQIMKLRRYYIRKVIVRIIFHRE